MRVLVLGGYGLIGIEVSRALIRAGHEVVGLARTARRGRAMLPQADWIAADIARLTTPERWTPHLDGIDCVVNAAGALQTGARDDVGAVQHRAVVALIAACEAAGPARFVQISAVGASPDAETEFMRTKGLADAALASSDLEWTLLRPGLVIAPTAYGGTSLLRALAAVPLLQPLLLPDAKVQTVAVDDVARAVTMAVEGTITRGPYDLVEDEVHRLAELVLAVRRWLGFAPPRIVLAVPRPLAYRLARLADLTGWLGWRPAARTTALKALEAGIVGDPEPWRRAAASPPKSLAQTLDALPATAQERLYARWQLVFPVALAILAGFWLVSGGIGLARRDAATEILADTMSESAAGVLVSIGAALDIAIGLGLTARRTVRWAALGAIAVSAGYLIAATALLPALWADPLGPLVKVVPASALALVVAAMAEER